MQQTLHCYTVGVERDTHLEVMNQSFHAFLHRCSRWWDDLVVIDLDRTGRHLVQALYHRLMRQPSRSCTHQKM